MLRLAVVVAELESRGEDLSDLKIGLLPILREIAAGKLLPDLVVLYSGRPAALKQASKMPVEEQRQLVSGERTMPTPPLKLRAPYKPPAETKRDVPGAREMAAVGTPRDVGELAADLILKCPDRQAAWAQLVERLKDNGAIPRAQVDAVRHAVTKPVKKFSPLMDDER